jgi:hypothetical protein
MRHFGSPHLTVNKVLEIFDGYFLPEDGFLLIQQARTCFIITGNENADSRFLLLTKYHHGFQLIRLD